MPDSPTTRPEWTVEDLLKPIDNDSGVYLRYEKIYDDIKEARKEDDPQLSQGVWQTDHKKADWIAIENWCVEALREQTRDLQLALWLTESAMAQDGAPGLIKGLTYVNAMAEQYWDTFFPEEEDFRIPLWEWIDHELHRRFLLLPITHRGHNYSDWLNALHLEGIRQKDPQKISRQELTISSLRKELDETRKRPLPASHIDKVTELLNQLKDLLDSKDPNNPSFSAFRRTLEEVRPLCALPEIKEEAPTEANEKGEESKPAGDEGGDQNVVISERSHAYQAIRDIGQFLLSLEPHSPAPQLLIMAGAWENYSITQILMNVQRSPDQQNLLRMLASGFKPPEETRAQPETRPETKSDTPPKNPLTSH